MMHAVEGISAVHFANRERCCALALKARDAESNRMYAWLEHYM
jgi:hypothetical protein